MYSNTSSMQIRWKAKYEAFFHTHPSIHPLLFRKRERNSSWWFGHYSLLYYILCALCWSLVFLLMMIRNKQWSWSSSSLLLLSIELLFRRRKIHFLSYVFLFSSHLIFLYSTKRTDVGLSKKCWSTWMFVISFHRAPGSHTHIHTV
jgi:hypothetical protein